MPPLARKYAAVLGTLATAVVFLRAVKEAAGPATAIWTALGYMAVFWIAGLVVGWLADAIVVESVKSQVEQQLQKQNASPMQKDLPSAREQNQSVA